MTAFFIESGDTRIVKTDMWNPPQQEYLQGITRLFVLKSIKCITYVQKYSCVVANSFSTTSQCVLLIRLLFISSGSGQGYCLASLGIESEKIVMMIKNR